MIGIDLNEAILIKECSDLHGENGENDEIIAHFSLHSHDAVRVVVIVGQGYVSD